MNARAVREAGRYAYDPYSAPGLVCPNPFDLTYYHNWMRGWEEGKAEYEKEAEECLEEEEEKCGSLYEVIEQLMLDHGANYAVAQAVAFLADELVNQED